jgi:hypothetical protein
MQTIENILQAIGVGAAAGLSPLTGLAAVVICAAIGLGLNTEGKSSYDFLASTAAVIVSVVVILQSLALIAVPGGLTFRVAADRQRLKLLHIGLALALGAAGGGIVMGVQNESTWAGAIVGGLAAALVAYASGNLLQGVNERLEAGEARQKKGASSEEKKAAKADTDASRRILGFGVDLVAMVFIVAALLVPYLGLILPIVAVALIFGSRRREAKKHEGLRVLN